MKPLVIYHADCADGFGAAFAAWLKLGDEAEYRPMNYTKDRALLEDAVASATNREVYILDFSFPRAEMDAIFENAKRVVWLDHHKTAFEMWCPEIYTTPHLKGTDRVEERSNTDCIVLDNNRSGAYLAWEYFHPGTEVPRLIQHIDDRDRWQFNLYGSKEFHAALASYKPWTFENWKARFIADGSVPYDGAFVDGVVYPRMLVEGKAILRAHNQNVQECLKQAMTCEIWSWVPFANAPGSVVNGFTRYSLSGLAANAPAFLASDLGGELANKSGTFGLVWTMAGDGQVHCSLRSNGEYDVSAIAKAFGGGGHRNAAGFSTDINTLLSWLR